MTYAQPPQQFQPPFRGRIALFPPTRPSKVSLSGACSINVQELPAFIQWLQSQQPDQYGNINLRIALFDSMSKGGRAYLSGYLQAPLPVPQPAQSAPQQTGAAYPQSSNPEASVSPQHQHAGWRVPPQPQTQLPLQPPSAAPVSAPQAAGSSATQAAPGSPQHAVPQGQAPAAGMTEAGSAYYAPF